MPGLFFDLLLCPASKNIPLQEKPERPPVRAQGSGELGVSSHDLSHCAATLHSGDRRCLFLLMGSDTHFIFSFSRNNTKPKVGRKMYPGPQMGSQLV